MLGPVKPPGLCAQAAREPVCLLRDSGHAVRHDGLTSRAWRQALPFFQLNRWKQPWRGSGVLFSGE